MIPYILSAVGGYLIGDSLKGKQYAEGGNVDLFSTPIKSKKVKNGVYAYMYPNGTININGIKFLGYSMTEAIKKWKKENG